MAVGTAEPSVAWRMDVAPERMQVMRSCAAGTGARVSRARSCAVSFSTGHRVLSRDLRVAFDDDGSSAEIALDFAYANFAGWTGRRVHVFGSEALDADGVDQWGFSVMRSGENTRWLFLCQNMWSARRWVEMLRSEGCVMSEFGSKYRLTRVLGNGGTSIVFHGEVNAHLGVNGRTIAVKAARTADGKRQLRLESRFLAMLEHKNIIRAQGLYEIRIMKETCLAMCMEYCAGGDLYNFLPADGMDEIQARGVLKQLLSAVAHCHKHNVVHRDIKFKNVLACQPANGGGLRVRLSDFGLAAHTSDEAEMTRRCGSPGFIAPEVLLRYRYSEKADSFSVGVLLYQILTGVMMFRGATMRRILDLNARALLPMGDLADRSAAVQELVRRLCAKDPDQRLSAAEALRSPWITGECPVLRQPRPPREEGEVASTAAAPTPRGPGADADGPDALLQRWQKGEIFPSQVLPLDNYLFLDHDSGAEMTFPEPSSRASSRGPEFVSRSDYTDFEASRCIDAEMTTSSKHKRWSHQPLKVGENSSVRELEFPQPASPVGARPERSHPANCRFQQGQGPGSPCSSAGSDPAADSPSGWLEASADAKKTAVAKDAPAAQCRPRINSAALGPPPRPPRERWIIECGLSPEMSSGTPSPTVPFVSELVDGLARRSAEVPVKLPTGPWTRQGPSAYPRTNPFTSTGEHADVPYSDPLSSCTESG